MQRVCWKIWLVIGCLLCVGGPAGAAEGDPHPVVPGFERLFAAPDTAGNDLVRGGQLLLGELNCTACHQAGNEWNGYVLPKQAPVLDGVGARVTPEFLRAFLADPDEIKPGTTMPDMLTGLLEQEKEQQVEALVHFFGSTGSLAHTLPDRGGIERGETLFHQIGCAACHGPQRDGAERSPAAAPLPDLAAKYSVSSLVEFLRDPLKVRPAARMPHMNLKDEEARDLASYLLRGLEVEPNLKYAYFEGNWDKLPDFAAMQPKETGETAGFDLGVARRKQNFGIRFEGFVHIPRDGEYTFHAGSDDGSRIVIDGKQVAINDGLHAFGFQSGKARLSAGVHPVVVDYFQAGGEWELRIEYEGPGLPRQPLAGAVTLIRETSPGGIESFTVNPQLAAQGRQIFTREGCASCHQLRIDNQPVLSQLVAKPLNELRPGQGCAARPAPRGLPDYHLSERQRAALNAALAAKVKPDDGPLDARETITRTLTALNCYACHERDKVGGVEEMHNALFETNMPEMGDEGRIPPHLTGVGDKLKAGWIQHILANGGDDRPYMLTRMPRFGGAHAEVLSKAFAAIDEQTLVEKPEYSEPIHRLKSSGRFLVGDQSLSCIKCHTFAGHQSTGIQATNLTKMTQRLREDWFHRYMINPQTYRSGTRMPSAWPNGRSVVPQVLDGNSPLQLAAIWEYLADGNNAPVPVGLGGQSIELVPESEPIIYRNFIEGVSPRGIAVGYPEKAHLAFDADRVSLALIWHGAFIDAAKHWTGRGQGFQQPLGDHVMRLPAGAPFATLESPQASWPAQPPKETGYRFRGYRLDDDRRPHFRYAFGGVEVEDFPKPVSGDKYPAFQRTLTLTADQPIEGLWYRAAAGKTVEPLDDGTYLVDGALTIRIEQNGAPSPVVRNSGGQSELLVPVHFTDGRAVIVQRYEW